MNGQQPDAVRPVLAAADLPVGAMRVVDVDGTSVLLANVDGELFATAAECSHEGAPLDEGDIDGREIECPWHFSRFCLRTGEALTSPAEAPLAVFDVSIRSGRICVATAASQACVE